MWEIKLKASLSPENEDVYTLWAEGQLWTDSPTGPGETLTPLSSDTVKRDHLRCGLWADFFFLAQGKLTFIGGLRAEPLQMNKREGTREKPHIQLTGRSCGV